MGEALQVEVNRHALDRWRERVAEYADATYEEVVAAVRRAVFLGSDEPTPFPKQPGKRYCRHADDPRVYFVLAPSGRAAVTVVTVIDYTEWGTAGEGGHRLWRRRVRY